MDNKSNIPIYISITSIFKNQEILLKTLESIIVQTKIPDKIYLYLSEEPYLLDQGFKNKKITNQKLLNFLIEHNNLIQVIWVKNIGPYRKLLSSLFYKWNENCLIITIDDDSIYDKNLVQNLIDDYNKYKCVINYRGFTPKFDKFYNFDYYKHDKLENLSQFNFPTGKAGILYHPSFFHKTKNLIFNHNIFLDTCKTCDDIWFYILRVLNQVNCYIGDKNFEVQDISSFSGDGLFNEYNSKNDNNNLSFKQTIKKLNISQT